MSGPATTTTTDASPTTSSTVLGETGAAVFDYLDVSRGDLIDHPQFEGDPAAAMNCMNP